mgnify:CR=1 FL=1
MFRIAAILTGITLMILSMVYLVVMLFTAPAPDSTGLLTAILCENGEIMTRSTGERFEPGFFQVNKVPTHLFCQNGDGDLREVTGQAFAVVMGSYAIIFLAGLFTFLYGFISLMRERMTNIRKAKRKVADD